MKNILLFASVTIASGLLFVNIYNSLIDVKSWGSEIPQSISIARQYYRAVNPGNFFRVFSPINQLLAILAVIIFWKQAPGARWYLGIAATLYILADVFTFAYFYPRNHFMFNSAQLTETARLTKTWMQWKSMNWLRSLIIFAGLIFSFVSLDKIYMVWKQH